MGDRIHIKIRLVLKKNQPIFALGTTNEQQIYFVEKSSINCWILLCEYIMINLQKIRTIFLAVSAFSKGVIR